MFNFIICDNDTFFLQKLKKIIIDNEEYESIIAFKEYTNSFFKIVNDTTIKNKFFILDIETNRQNGIIIASKIRNTDRNSIIVFCTGYDQKYAYKIAKSRFRYDALINKFENLKKDLHEVIVDNKKYINTNRRISVKINANTNYTMELEELYYLKIEKESQKLIVQIVNQQFTTYESLSALESQLNKNFIKVNRSCIVNKKYAIFDYDNNIINFPNNIILKDIMSQSFIKLHKN